MEEKETDFAARCGAGVGIAGRSTDSKQQTIQAVFVRQERQPIAVRQPRIGLSPCNYSCW